MARRVATDYKCMKLEVSSKQLQTLLDLFVTHYASTEVRVFENGDTELILSDDDDRIPLIFRPLGSHYLFEGSFCTKDLKLANAFRKAVQEYKGYAIVHRIYPTYVMVYYYEYGEVTKIEEVRGKDVRVVYEYQDSVGIMQRMLSDQRIEAHIEWVKWQIDWLLDQRLSTQNVQAIDQRLKALTQELMVLEA
jgi:hypothetical protein